MDNWNQGYGQQQPNNSYGSNSQQQYNYNMSMQQQGYQMNMQQPQGYVYSYEQPNAASFTDSLKKRIFNVSAIMGFIATILLLMGLLMPMIDFSHFHENVDIQYNIIKICKNVRMISSIWMGIPAGIIIGIVMMFVFSFIKLPILKLFPCLLVLSMCLIMLIDMSNIVEWANDFLNGSFVQSMIKQEFEVNNTEVFGSLEVGIYLLAAGLVIGFISCFVKAPKED